MTLHRLKRSRHIQRQVRLFADSMRQEKALRSIDIFADASPSVADGAWR
jgi:hypothetical protein